jgi:hypothetical protein
MISLTGSRVYTLPGARHLPYISSVIDDYLFFFGRRLRSCYNERMARVSKEENLRAQAMQ